MLSGAVVAAVRFAPVAWRGAWAALLLTAGATAAVLAAIVGGQGIGPVLLWLLVAFSASLVARGALWRLALQHGHLGPGGLQVGAVEGRLAAVSVLTGVLLAILIVLLFVGLLCLAYAAASAGRGFDPANVATWGSAVDSRGRVVMSVATMAGAGAIVLAAVRISLADAVCVAGG